MSKKKFIVEDPVERLEKENRELKQFVRSLQKQLKKSNKNYHKLKDTDNDIEEDKKEIIKYNVCPSCHNGKLEEVIIAGRKFERCQTCEYRNKAKKING